MLTINFDQNGASTLIFINSFPRSGHHMLVQLTSAIYPQLSYCEKYTCRDQWNENIQCSGKDLPIQSKIICRANKSIQKSHDFQLDEPVFEEDNIKYVVLIRNPIDAIISWWRLQLEEPNTIDSRLEFEKFFEGGCHFWNGFCQKWIVPAKHVSQSETNDQLVYVTYEGMVEDRNILKNTVKQLIPPAAHFLCDRHDDIFEKFAMNPNKNIHDFKYYGEELLTTARSIIRQDLTSKLDMSIYCKFK